MSTETVTPQGGVIDRAAPVADRWLFNARADMLLGCGGAYAIFFILLTVAGTTIREYFPISMTPLVALALSIPHYGSTLLRVYEREESRRKYQFFAVYLTIVVWAFFVAGVYSDLYASLLVTLYLMWSPWHYMGQNYGIALMFLGRRRIFVSPSTKRLLHVSFLASYALALVEMQSLPSTGQNITVYTLGLSNAVRDACFVVLGTLYVATTVRVLYDLLRRASLSDVLPTLMLMGSQALWFLVPLVAIRFQLMQTTVSMSMDYAFYAFFWVAMAHGVQYLWITSYFARRAAPSSTTSVFYGKALAAGALIWVVPAVLFAPNVFGRLSYDAGLAVLVAAAVNVHHFILDGAIWKLRDGPVARILLRSENAAGPGILGETAPLLGRVLLAVGAICVVSHYFGTVNRIDFDRATSLFGSAGEIAQLSDRLKWVGRDSAENQVFVGWRLLNEGQTEMAKDRFQRAKALGEAAGGGPIDEEITRSIQAVEGRAPVKN